SIVITHRYGSSTPRRWSGSPPSSESQRPGFVADAQQGPARRLDHERAVDVGGDGHLWRRGECGEEGLPCRPRESLARLVHALRSLFERVVRFEDGADGIPIAAVGDGTSSAASAPWSSRSLAAEGSGSPPRAPCAAGRRIFCSIPMCRKSP